MFLGTFKVYKLDQNQPIVTPKQSEPKTTLARRRAEKRGQTDSTPQSGEKYVAKDIDKKNSLLNSSSGVIGLLLPL